MSKTDQTERLISALRVAMESGRMRWRLVSSKNGQDIYRAEWSTRPADLSGVEINLCPAWGCEATGYLAFASTAYGVDRIYHTQVPNLVGRMLQQQKEAEEKARGCWADAILKHLSTDTE